MGRTPLPAVIGGRQHEHVESAQAIRPRSAGSNADVPVQRLVIVVGDAADGRGACRIDAPGRLLRVWSLLQAMTEEIRHTAPPAQAAPRLQRELRVIRRELENTVSPPLAAELRRIAPPLEAPLSIGALRIEYGVLANWASSLVSRMLIILTAEHERRPRDIRSAR
jgi:hypothetical protein